MSRSPDSTSHKTTTPPLEWGHASQSGHWRFRLSSLEDSPALQEQWTELQSRADCSFFQSWGWIDNWIGALPPRLRPRPFEVRLDDRLVGLALLGRRTLWRRGILPSNALFVSETGDPEFDCITVEHNGFLVDRALSATIVQEATSGLAALKLPWDELFISGVARDHVEDYVHGARSTGLCAVVKIEKPDHFVDCEGIRQSGGNYLEVLSRNTRYQIRRAMRAYEEHAAIEFHVAQTLEQAKMYFDDLRRIHQQYWISKGLKGAFGSPFTLDLHRNLISRRFSNGEIQLAKICVGTNPIGYLYNFVWKGVVSNYQSAFVYDGDGRLKPGLVSHCCAIQYNIKAGMKTYDLLMGNQRFKQNLATGRDKMAWIVLQKPRIRFRLENAAIRWRDRLRGMRNRAAAESDTGMVVQ